MKRQPDVREDEFQELLREHPVGASAVPDEVRDLVDHLSPSELRSWLEGLSREDRQQFLNAGVDALVAGRQWRQSKWRAVREHPLVVELDAASGGPLPLQEHTKGTSCPRRMVPTQGQGRTTHRAHCLRRCTVYVAAETDSFAAGSGPNVRAEEV